MFTPVPGIDEVLKQIKTDVQRFLNAAEVLNEVNRSGCHE
jgi:hypothetical protein